MEDKIIHVSVKMQTVEKYLLLAFFPFSFALMHLKPKWVCCLYIAAIYIIIHLTEEEKFHVGWTVFGRHIQEGEVLRDLCFAAVQRGQ